MSVMMKLRSYRIGILVPMLLSLATPLTVIGAEKESSDAAAVDELKDELEELKEQERNTRKTLTQLEGNLRRLNSMKASGDLSDPQFPEFARGCDCKPMKSGGCSESYLRGRLRMDDEEFASFVESDDTAACKDIIQRAGSLGNVDASCQAKVRSCGAIALDLRIAASEREISDLREKIKTEFPAERKRISAELRREQKNCADCQMKAQMQMMGYREPGIGDYIVSGLQAITPMALGGMGMVMYGQGLNAQMNMYGSCLGAAQNVGVPIGANCGWPMAGMGGGFGGMGVGMMPMGMYGGGMGMYGGGMGMMAGGGMIMGGGIMMGGGMMMGGYPTMGMMTGGGMMMGGGIMMGGGMMMGGMMPAMVPMMPMMPSMGMMPMMGGMYSGGMGMMAGGGMIMGGGIMMGGGMMSGGGLYPMMPMTAGYGVPMYPYGSGFPVGMGMMSGGGMIMGGGIMMGGGMMSGGGYPMMPVMMGGYPGGMYSGGMGMMSGGGMIMGGGLMMGGGMYSGGMGMYSGGMGMYSGGMGMMAGGGMMVGGGMMSGGMGMMSGGSGYYNGLTQSSMYNQMMMAQQASGQQELMIAQQQIMESQQRYYQLSSGGFGYGGGGSMLPGVRPF